jgi:hypothetical protein
MMLTLDLHDSEEGNTLAARVGANGSITYDYQAEEWVKDTYSDEASMDPRPNRWIVRWVLKDTQGERAVWERPSGDPSCPKLVRKADRFRGEWQLGA